MNKDVFLLGVCLLVLAAGGGYHYYSASRSRPTPDAIAAAKSALAENPPARPSAAPAHPPRPAAVNVSPSPAADQAARAQTEAALASMKVSSILLGDPAIVIISKKEYSVGDSLPLPGKPPLKLTAINDDGVTLAANGQTYHLDAPAAPDLAASRKK